MTCLVILLAMKCRQKLQQPGYALVCNTKDEDLADRIEEEEFSLSLSDTDKEREIYFAEQTRTVIEGIMPAIDGKGITLRSVSAFHTE